MNVRHIRRGFTLVELLVVAAIMAVFFSIIVTGAKPNPNGQIRNAAQQLASVLSATQSQALGNPVGAAVILDSGTASGLAATMSVAVFRADTPPLTLGTTVSGSLSVQTSGSESRAEVGLVPFNADPEDLQNGYKIQFGGEVLSSPMPYQTPSPWFSFSYAGASGNVATGTAAFRFYDGQTPWNTIWPEPTRAPNGSANPFVFRMARYPLKADIAYQLPKTVAVDLRYSGVGENPLTMWNVVSQPAPVGWGCLAGKGAIAVSFDAVGGIEHLMQQVTGAASLRTSQPPVDPVEPVYLLVNSRDAIEGSAAPLGSEMALWVVIQPQNGRVSIASNVPQTGTDAVALRAARARARAGVVGNK